MKQSRFMRSHITVNRRISTHKKQLRKSNQILGFVISSNCEFCEEKIMKNTKVISTRI